MNEECLAHRNLTRVSPDVACSCSGSRRGTPRAARRSLRGAGTRRFLLQFETGHGSHLIFPVTLFLYSLWEACRGSLVARDGHFPSILVDLWPFPTAENHSFFNLLPPILAPFLSFTPAISKEPLMQKRPITATPPRCFLWNVGGSLLHLLCLESNSEGDFFLCHAPLRSAPVGRRGPLTKYADLAWLNHHPCSQPCYFRRISAFYRRRGRQKPTCIDAKWNKSMSRCLTETALRAPDGGKGDWARIEVWHQGWFRCRFCSEMVASFA